MKRYIGKQLEAMTPEELEKVQKQALDEWQKACLQLEELLAKNPQPAANRDEQQPM